MPQATCDFVYDDVVLRRDSQRSLQQQLIACLRALILNGRLRRGGRMPSSRRLAAEQGISRTTVVEAYERLEAEGYIFARPRAGFFVAQALPEDFSARARRPASMPPPASAASTDSRSCARSLAQADEWLLPLAPGIPAIDRFPWRVWTKLSNDILRTRTIRAIAPADPRGEPVLRDAVADYLGTFRGVPCSPEQVIIANGCQPIIEMLVHALAKPGDAVWFEEPGDPASRAVLENLGVKPIPIFVDDEGLDVNEGRRAAPEARLALVAPSHHYPLGVTMSTARRRALLDWAAERGAWVIENEIDGDYRFARGSREPLHMLDTEGRVIYLGSFNKAVAPGLRVGYAVVPKELIPAMSVSAMVGVPQQLQLTEFWVKGHLAAHVRTLRQIHARRRSALLAALRENADDIFELGPPPEAGLRIAVSLRRGANDAGLVRECLAAGIKLGRPLSECYAARGRATGFTVGFASTPSHRIAPAVRRLVAVIGSAAGNGG
jgi:GntR family transcriptional regulator/MocR family aminotransferase